MIVPPPAIGPQLNERPAIDRENMLDERLTGGRAGVTIPTAGSEAGQGFRPHPALPSTAQLDYVGKAGTAVLVIVAAVLVLRSPRRLLRAAERRAGVR